MMLSGPHTRAYSHVVYAQNCSCTSTASMHGAAGHQHSGQTPPPPNTLHAGTKIFLQVERPINSFPPVAMILLSFLSLGSAITGLVGGHKWACCLDAFLALHSIDTLCKMILVIVLW